MENINSNLTERLQEIQRSKSHVKDDKSNVAKSLEDELREVEETKNTSTFKGDFDDELDLTEQDIENIMDDISDESVEKDEEPIITPEERAKIAAEKYAPIKTREVEEVQETMDDEIGGDLFRIADELEKENEKISEDIQEKQEIYLKEIATPAEESEVLHDEEGVDDILEDMGRQTDEDEVDAQNTDWEKILEQYEERKLFSNKVTGNDVIAGPADYIIEKDETYAENIENILKSNNIVITRKNKVEKNAILDRFTNSGDKVTMTLVNSGIYVTMSGAGATEIISMNSMDGSESETRIALNKLDHVSQHIVGSSVGKLTLSQLIKVVSYYDLDSLYYALFAATHPDESELSRVCSHCNEEYYLKVKTKDLLINASSFEKSASDIRDNVTTYSRLIETSKLGKVYKKAYSNGMIVYYKHPSIESYLTTMRNISSETMTKYFGIIDMVYSIEKIAIRDSGNSFIEISDPNEILEVIARIKSVDERYDIYGLTQSIIPEVKPEYGFNRSVCPHCGKENSVQAFTMENILFSSAQREEMEASIRWAIKSQKMRESKKK
jgi:hypothetical protein